VRGPFGRLLICEPVLELGWTVAETPKAAGVSPSAAHKWVRRHREGGFPACTTDLAGPGTALMPFPLARWSGSCEPAGV
jgi:hypothetical protein